MWASSFGVRRACRPSVPAALGALLVAAWTASPAHALQVLDARDGVAVEAILSIKEATRIRIEGAPITDVFGKASRWKPSCRSRKPRASASKGRRSRTCSATSIPATAAAACRHLRAR